jgi:hypothetical protein
VHAMNYRITLPADYDMETVRHRVATRGHLLDDFPGLGMKAYLIREKGVDGSPVNQYAPFYLWNTAEGMNSFLWGPGFRGLTGDFGRPAVEHWTGLGFFRGPSFGAVPRTAVRRSEPIAAAQDPAEVISRALDELARTAGRPGVHCAALLVDPRHWELLRFTLWQDAAPDVPGEDRHEVLHLSAPGLDGITTGRHW